MSNNGTLWMTGDNNTSLYVKITTTGYQWIMVSPKTGKHIINTGYAKEPVMNERVKAHWDGFQKNQTR